MTWAPFPLVGAAYNDEARPWSSQRLVNMLLVPAEAEGTRSRAKLVGVPGLDGFCRGMQEAPVRGLHNCEGLLLAVAGDMLYRISPTAVAIPIGQVPGTGIVEMAHNQIQNGYEVLVANNQAGYVYNTRTGNYAQVTDAGFPGLRSPQFIDGYIAGVEPQGRFWAHSDLRQAAEWNTLDRYAAEARPDKIQLLRVNNRSVLVLGESSGQFFRNTGALTGTFANENGTEFAVGAASRYAAEVVDNNVVWLGNDGLVYTLNGASPVILSTGPIAQAMAQNNLASCFTMLWEDNKHKVVYFTFPQGQTFGLDLWTRTWHERVSYGMDRWRVSALCRWSGQWIAGDFYNGRLYRLNRKVQKDYDQPLVRRRITAAIHADENEVFVNALRIVANTGQPSIEPAEFPIPPVGPSIEGAAPDGEVGQEYAGYTYTITEGDAPIASVVITSGTVPAGLAFDAGVIDTGDPTTAGSSTFTIRVTDTNGLFADLTDTIFISAYYRVFGSNTSTTVIQWSDFAFPWDPTRFIESPTTHDLIQIGGGKLFAIGSSAVSVYDLDAETWEVGTTDAPPSSSAKSFLQTGPSKWIYCTGSNPSVMYRSTDGLNFAGFSVGISGQVYSLAKRGDVIIGASSFNNWVRSTDEGDTWIASASPFSARVVRATEQGFFAISGGSSYGWGDENGSNWIVRSLPGGLLCNRMDVGNDKVMVITQDAQVFVGPMDPDDGDLELVSTLPIGLGSTLNDNRLVFAGGKWFTGGNNDHAFTSEDDGQTWEDDDLSAGSGGMRTFAAEVQE
jgi:hypothetical protein